MSDSFGLRRLGLLATRARYHSKVWFRSRRRQLFLRLRAPRLASQMEDYRRLVEAKDWRAALPKALDLATIAEAEQDVRLLDELGKALVRMGAYGSAARLKIKSRHILKGRDPREWLGDDIAGRTLLIDLMETEKQGLATAINHAGSVSKAARRAKRCILLVEHRLIPLFQRTFPDIDVQPAGTGKSAAYAKADIFAGVQHLTAIFETDKETIQGTFVPLKPNQGLVSEFRDRYRGDGLPLVGVAWGSTNPGKDLPPLGAWAPVLGTPKIRFVSLQYGRIGDDLNVLNGSASEPILHDTTVDQLVDMDRFAAQVAAMDVIVTISNTGAQLAGALGMPSVFVLGDGFKRSWPVDSDRTPYYPSAILVSKRHRDWEELMAEARQNMCSLINEGWRPLS
jgi:hypothetical protein